MSRRLKQAAVVLIVLFAAAQFLRPDRTNPPIDASRTMEAQLGTANGLTAVLDRSCRDCHSNRTVWPRYTQVAPLSWLMAYGVRQGRQVFNFSEWAAYPPDRQQQLLDQSCKDVTAGKMPGAYTWLHPEMRLSAQDVETVCAAARKAQPNAPSSPTR